VTRKDESEAAEILLVEDNPGDARLTLEAFRDGQLNNNLNHVRDGVEAMAYLRREAPFTQSVRPDLILLDLNMPRMGGAEVLKELKGDPTLKSIPVLILTTSQAEKDIASSYIHQANCFIRKPVDFDEFLAVVQDIESFWLTIVKLPGHPAVAA